MESFPKNCQFQVHYLLAGASEIHNSCLGGITEGAVFGLFAAGILVLLLDWKDNYWTREGRLPQMKENEVSASFGYFKRRGAKEILVFHSDASKLGRGSIHSDADGSYKS